MEKKIEMNINGGKLVLHTDDAFQQAGVTFSSDDGDDIDIVQISITDKNGKEPCNPDHKELDQIKIAIYSDPYNDNASSTHILTIPIYDIKESCKIPFMPDSMKID